MRHETQHEVIGVATSAAEAALRGTGERYPLKATRLVANAAVEAWSVVNGVNPSPSPDAAGGTLQ